MYFDTYIPPEYRYRNKCASGIIRFCVQNFMCIRSAYIDRPTKLQRTGKKNNQNKKVAVLYAHKYKLYQKPQRKNKYKQPTILYRKCPNITLTWSPLQTYAYKYTVTHTRIAIDRSTFTFAFLIHFISGLIKCSNFYVCDGCCVCVCV